MYADVRPDPEGDFIAFQWPNNVQEPSPSEIRHCNIGCIVLGLLSTGISAWISALATALRSALHDYRFGLANQTHRSSNTSILTAAEPWEGLRGTAWIKNRAVELRLSSVCRYRNVRCILYRRWGTARDGKRCETLRSRSPVPNYRHDPIVHRQRKMGPPLPERLRGTTATLGALSIVTTALRCYVRLRVIKKWGADDTFIILAFVSIMFLHLLCEVY